MEANDRRAHAERGLDDQSASRHRDTVTDDTYASKGAPMQGPPSSRVMAWTPGTGWAVRQADADEIERCRRGPPAITTCVLAGDRHRKRSMEPEPVQAPASTKRRRTVAPLCPPPLPMRSKPRQQQQQQQHEQRKQQRQQHEQHDLHHHHHREQTAVAPNTRATARKRPLAMTAVSPPAPVATSFGDRSSRSASSSTTTTRATMAGTTSPPPPLRRLFEHTPPRLWKRVRALGCGTFGCVREVTHPETGKHFAIKEMGLLPNDYRGSRDGAAGDAFRPGISPPSIHMAFRELAAVAALDGHPCVVRVRDAYLAMPRAGHIGVGNGVECALLMDLMDGHLGRVVRFLAGHGDARLSSATSMAPSASLPAGTSSSSSSSLSTTTSSSSSALSLSSSSLVSSLFSSAGPLCPSSASSGHSTPSTFSSSSSLASTTPTMTLPDADPCGQVNPASATGLHAGQRSSIVSPCSSPQNVPHRTGGACPFELRVHVARLVARDILRALVFMHERLGMAHRDIKPNNILYIGDVASDTLRFRLADFGLARFVCEARRDAPARGAERRRRRRRIEPGETNTPSAPALNTDDSNRAPASATATRAGSEAAIKDAVPHRRPATTTSKCRANHDVHDSVHRTEGAHLGPCFTANVVTHLYKPPELLLHYATRRATERGLAYGCAVDMWSFGVVLMEVLAGGHLTPSEPEETLVRRVRAVFRLDGPPRPHLVADLVRAMEARAATGRSGVGSIMKPSTSAPTAAKAADGSTIVHGSRSTDGKGAEKDDKASYPSPYGDLIDLVERLLCVDPQQRITAAEALRHPFVVGGDHDEDRHEVPTDALHDAPRFLGSCPYEALGCDAARSGERARAGDHTITTCTLAARKVAVSRACTFADRYDLKPHTVACAIAMLDHYLERAAACNDEGLLLASAGALLVACSLYECRWPAYDQFVSLAVVPHSWYGVERRAPSNAVRTPASDAVLRAAVDLFNALGHMTPHVDAVAPLIDGSLAIGRERKDPSPWRAMTATFARYPPSLTLVR